MAERDTLGRLVRDTWVGWAKEQPDPKPHWLEPWEQLPESMRAVDRRIGYAVGDAVLQVFNRRRLELIDLGGRINEAQIVELGALQHLVFEAIKLIAPRPAGPTSEELDALGKRLAAKTEG